MATLQGELGFQNLPNDPEAAQARLVAAYRQQVERNRQYEALLMQHRQVAPHAASHAAGPAVTPNTVTPNTAAPASPNSPAGSTGWSWAPPQIDRDLVARYRVKDSASGEEGWKPGTPQSVIDQVSEWEKYHVDWERKLLTQPDQVFPQIISRYVPQLVEQAIADYEGRKQQVAFEQSLVANHTYLFEQDPVTGGPVRTPDGQYVLSTVGLEIDNLCSQYAGLGDQRKIFETALTMYEKQHGPITRPGQPAAALASPAATAPVANQPAAPVINPQEVAAQKRAEFLQQNNGAPPQIIPFPAAGQAAYPPGRNGMTPPSGSTPVGIAPQQLQNQSQGFGDFLLQDLANRGINLAAM